MNIISRSRTAAVVAAAAFCIIAGAGCAPAYNRVAVPRTVVSADTWWPARPGVDIKLTTVQGVRYEGTIEAIGDSISVMVLKGPGPRVQTFSRADIEDARVRPPATRGEGAFGAIMLTLMTALLAAYIIPWNFD